MAETIPMFPNEESDQDPWGEEAHMGSLRAYAAREAERWGGTPDEKAAFVAGLRLAAHCLRHLFSAVGVLPPPEYETIAGDGLDVIEAVAAAVEEGREP